MASKNAELLRRVELFSNLPDVELEKLARLVQERRYREDQMLFQQGDPGDALYIVTDGRVKVFIREGNRETVLSFFGEGDVLGEMALLTGEPRSASAVATSESKLLTLSKESFAAHLTTNMDVMGEMLRVMAVRQFQMNLRLTRGEAAAAETEAKGGKVYVVFSPRGGSGKTTIAVNLAVAFAQIHPEEVALLDLSLTFGHCALALNLVPKASLSNISLDSLSKLDREGFQYYLVPHDSTLKVLVGSNKPEEGEAVSAGHVKEAVEKLKRFHLVVVVDSGSTFAEATLAALESADKVILVCSPDLPSLRDVRECQRIFNDLIRLPKEKIYYVMNHTLPVKVLAPEQFTQALEQEMNAEIPYGGDVPSKASTRGEAFTQTQPGSNVAKAIDRIAKALEEEAAPKKAPERRGIFARR